MMVGFDVGQHYPKERNAQDRPRLEVEHLSTDNGVDDVSFTVRVGEVFGLGGMLGSGRTEIVRAIYGLDRITAGHIRMDGKEARFRSAAQAIQGGVGLIPEDRKSDGSFFNFEGPKNITISRLSALLQGPWLSLSREQKIANTYFQKLDISSTAMERSVQYLSGGNQQKVIIARWLFSEARLLIMDEPTQGIDIGAKHEIYKVINELTANGISVLLISSDFPELLAMSDRVAVIRDGHILQITGGDRMSEYDLISHAAGVGLVADPAS
jgi:ribose transport system ATP-binding protein